MSIVHATWSHGQIIPTEPVSWPEGTPLRIEPFPDQLAADMTEETWPTTSDDIVRLVARMDHAEPLTMTEQEFSRWQAELAMQKQLEKSRFNDHADSLGKGWE